MGLPKPPDQVIEPVVSRLFREIAPRFKDRPGGYTRILKLGKHRLGDNAEQVLLEFVATGEKDGEGPSAPKDKEKKPAKSAEGSA